MLRSHTARLTVGAAREGVELSNFDELSVTVDMLAPGSPWTVSLWNTSGDAAWRRLQRLCRQGEAVRVYLDDALVLHGTIDKVSSVTSRSQKTLVLSGSSLAGRAIEWHADPRIVLQGMTLEAAGEELFRAVHVHPVLITSGARQAEVQSRPHRERPLHSSSSTRRRHRARRTNKVNGLEIKPGDAIWSTYNKLCRRSGYWLWECPIDDGVAVVVDVPKTGGPAVFTFARLQAEAGVYGGNIEDSTYDVDGTRVPTHLGAFASTRLDAHDDARGRWIEPNTRYLSHPRVGHDSTTNASLTPKPYYFEPSHCGTVQELQKAIERAIAECMADFESYDLTVQGWGQVGPDGVRRLYAVNTMSHLRDDTEEPPLDGLWLITRVTFTRSREGGTMARLRLVPDGALVVTPAET